MGAWFDFPQIWTNTTSSSTEYTNYGGIHYSYNTDAIKYTHVPEDINGLFSSVVSTSEAESWFNYMEITTPIKRRGAKMG